MVEQRPFKPKVVGSIPTAPTKILIEIKGLAIGRLPAGAMLRRKLSVNCPCSSPACTPMAYREPCDPLIKRPSKDN